MDSAQTELLAELKTQEERTFDALVQSYPLVLAASTSLGELAEHAQLLPDLLVTIQQCVPSAREFGLSKDKDQHSRAKSPRDELLVLVEHRTCSGPQFATEQAPKKTFETHPGTLIPELLSVCSEQSRTVVAADLANPPSEHGRLTGFPIRYAETELLRAASRLLRRSWECAQRTQWPELLKARVLHYRCGRLLSSIPTDALDARQHSSYLYDQTASQLRAQWASLREELLERFCTAACAVCLDDLNVRAIDSSEELGVLISLQLDLELDIEHVVQKLFERHSAQVAARLRTSACAGLFLKAQHAIRAACMLLDLLSSMEERASSEDAIVLRVRSLEWNEIDNIDEVLENLNFYFDLSSLKPSPVMMSMRALEPFHRRWADTVSPLLKGHLKDLRNPRKVEESMLSLSELLQQACGPRLEEQPLDTGKPVDGNFFRSMKRDLLMILVKPLDALLPAAIEQEAALLMEGFKGTMFSLMRACIRERTILTAPEVTRIYVPLTPLMNASGGTETCFPLTAPGESSRRAGSIFGTETCWIPSHELTSPFTATTVKVDPEIDYGKSMLRETPLLLEAVAESLDRACSSVEECILRCHRRTNPIFHFFSEAEVEFFQTAQKQANDLIEGIIVDGLYNAVRASVALDCTENLALPCIAFVLCFSADTLHRLQTRWACSSRSDGLVAVLTEAARRTLRFWLRLMTDAAVRLRERFITREEARWAKYLQSVCESREQLMSSEIERTQRRYWLANLRCTSPIKSWHAVLAELLREEEVLITLCRGSSTQVVPVYSDTASTVSNGIENENPTRSTQKVGVMIEFSLPLHAGGFLC